jgi:hypothetical protein|tara:strand:- start:920 stop:1288 length:369 start_codon:yes stop_codon:yes gene_type:complete
MTAHTFGAKSGFYHRSTSKAGSIHTRSKRNDQQYANEFYLESDVLESKSNHTKNFRNPKSNFKSNASNRSHDSQKIHEGSNEDFSSTYRGGTFGKNRRVMADWNRAKDYVDKHLEKKSEKFK